MEKKYLSVLVICAIAIALGAGWFIVRSDNGGGFPKAPAKGLRLNSPAFENNERIPDKYTYDGQDISPPLEISGSEGESLVIIMDDSEAGGFVHWMAWNIPGDMESVPEGISQDRTVEALDDARQGTNDFDEIGYRGPKPPNGEEHEYVIRLFALDESLELESGSSKDQLLDAMRGHVVQMTTLVGTYSR